MKCPHCGGKPTYIGANTIECGTPGCVNCSRKGPEAYILNNNIYVEGCTVKVKPNPLAESIKEYFDKEYKCEFIGANKVSNNEIKEGDYVYVKEGAILSSSDKRAYFSPDRIGKTGFIYPRLKWAAIVKVEYFSGIQEEYNNYINYVDGNGNCWICHKKDCIKSLVVQKVTFVPEHDVDYLLTQEEIERIS